MNKKTKKIVVKGYETFFSSQELINWQMNNPRCTVNSITPLASNVQFHTNKLEYDDDNHFNAKLETQISVFVIFEKIIEITTDEVPKKRSGIYGQSERNG